MVAAFYRQLTPEQRMRIASDMFDTARAIVESSLPSGLSRSERRLALARRLYGHELPEKALLAFAAWHDEPAGRPGL
ncbi:MAG TPA: hypothetical protein VJ011_07945 [Steroidobacteraceae bacterium]|nr:hypothetical protein [Steroidobacteraceae bacterium]